MGFEVLTMDELDIAKKRMNAGIQDICKSFEMIFGELPTLKLTQQPIKPTIPPKPKYNKVNGIWEFPPFETAEETHIEKLIENNKSSLSIDFSNTQSQIEEEEKLMRLNKNIRKRKDGRFEWRKTIQGTSHYLIKSNLKDLVKEVTDYKKTQLKPNTKPKEQKTSRKLIDVAWTWFNLYKKGQTTSDRQYTSRLENYISKLTKDIGSYTKNDIIEFLNSIPSMKAKEYCFIILKNVFAEATEAGTIKRNPIATLKLKKDRNTKGLWFNVEEQQLIYENRHKCTIGNEIEFFLMVGCRLSEAPKCRLELDKLRIWVERTKAHGSSGYVPISQTYAEKLKNNWSNMFKQSNIDFYTREFVILLKLLKIERQKNEKPIHRLRHTFATNLYYFGVDDKKRSYLLGHSSTKITNDIYTDFYLDIKGEDILNIYKDLYPIF